MSEEKKEKFNSIMVDEAFKNEVKIASAKLGISIKKFVEDTLRERMKKIEK